MQVDLWLTTRTATNSAILACHVVENTYMWQHYPAAHKLGMALLQVWYPPALVDVLVVHVSITHDV